MAKQHGLPAGPGPPRPPYLFSHLWGSAVLASGCAGLANVNHSTPHATHRLRTSNEPNYRGKVDH